MSDVFRDQWERGVVPRLRRNENVTIELSAVDALYLRRVALSSAESHADNRDVRLAWKRISAGIEMGFTREGP